MIETIITPRTRDLGDGFHVRRVLPDARRRSVGPEGAPLSRHGG